jgi:hypothetical protein
MWVIGPRLGRQAAGLFYVTTIAPPPTGQQVFRNYRQQ